MRIRNGLCALGTGWMATLATAVVAVVAACAVAGCSDSDSGSKPSCDGGPMDDAGNCMTDSGTGGRGGMPGVGGASGQGGSGEGGAGRGGEGGAGEGGQGGQGGAGEGGQGGQGGAGEGGQGGQGGAGEGGAGGGAGASPEEGPSCALLPKTCGAEKNESCCAFIETQGGSFKMGDNAIAGATPEHDVTLDTFYLDKYEVTVGRFRKFVDAYETFRVNAGDGAHPLVAGSGWDASWPKPADKAALVDSVMCDRKNQTWTDAPGENDNKPINCVTWHTAFLFCLWDGGRLPTEAELEYASAGGSEERQYPWGSDDPDVVTRAVFNCNVFPDEECSTPKDLPSVGSIVLGAGRWGHMDLAGSVWEWALDWSAPYTDAKCVNCANVTPGTKRVRRGGGWDGGKNALQAAYRDELLPKERVNFVGVRCARMH